jgi:peptidoglycan biosynthesis protein MviN/MurJ (putative lipid II flippase)
LVNLGVAGLGLALSLGILLEITLLILILRRRWQWSVWNELGSTFVRVMLASVLMGAVVWLVNLVWEQMGLANQGRLLTLVQISVLGVVGVLSYVLWSWIFRIREIFDFMRMLLQQRGQGMKNVN